MPSGFTSQPLNLASVLSDPHLLRVPDYQRPYSWTVTEAGQLLDDLAVAMHEGALLDDADEGYFLGSVLLMRHSAGPLAKAGEPARGRQVHDIVDGQQRLITVTILLAVIRDLAADRGLRLSTAIDPYLWSRAGDQQVEPRVAPRGQEGNFLRTFVQEAGASVLMPDNEDLRLGENRIIEVREHLAEALMAYGDTDLDALASYLLQSCHLSVITTFNIDRAYRIFFVLNSRGRHLARNQILKVQILGAIAPERRSNRVDAWDQIEHRLGRHFESLFSHIRVAEGSTRSRIVNGIGELLETCGDAERFFDDILVPYATIYGAVQAELASPAGTRTLVARYLGYLDWLGGADWIPPLLLFWRRCNGDQKALERFLQRLDRVAYGLRILGLGADKRLTRFNAVLAAVRDDKALDPTSAAFEFSRDELRNIQYNLRNLHSRSQLTCKLVLSRLNDELAKKPLALDPGDYTVEHVLPQKPGRSSTWRIWFPNADERESYTQSLGNLVLVTRSQNERARNMELSRKLEVYFSTDGAEALPITQELFDIKEWSGPMIKAREERFMSVVSALWSLDYARQTPETEQTDAAASKSRRRTLKRPISR